MLKLPLDSHLVKLSFFLCTCGDTHLDWQKEIPNYQLKYQLVWCVEPPHWTSHCMCDTCVPHNISPGQKRKYLPQTVTWLDLGIKIREKSSEPYVKLFVERLCETIWTVQWPKYGISVSATNIGTEKQIIRLTAQGQNNQAMDRSSSCNRNENRVNS